jgi:hypothetical protein
MKRKFLGLAALTVTLLFLPQYAQACFPWLCSPAAVSRKAPGLVAFDGNIEAPAVAKATALLRPGDTLRITSPDGEEGPALKLAEVVRERGVKVSVFSNCFGPCANYVFLAGAAKEVQRGSYLLFDLGYPMILRAALAASPHAFNAKDSRDLMAIGAADDRLLAALGVTPQFHACLEAAVGVDRSAVAKDASAADIRLIGSRRRADYIAISKAALERFGVKGIGDTNPVDGAADRQHFSEFWNSSVAWVDTGEDCATAPVTSLEQAKP